MDSLPSIVAVMGTNASGKSALAVRLARHFSGEVVSADSRQVFCGLDLGSGKITREEMQGVPHHLIDVVRPNDFYSMADFQRQAYRAIDGILARGHLPFLAGGTGLYLSAVTEGYRLSDKAPDLSYRAELEQLSTATLARMLEEELPGSGIDPDNRNRVMRMLEKLHSGDPGPGKSKPRYRVLKLGVTWDRETLKQRIDQRLALRMEQGMVEEVRRLLAEGASETFLKKLGLEYRYLTRYLAGEFPDEKAMTEELSLAIKRFAKRQMTWFKRDTEIHWLDMRKDPFGQASTLIKSFLS
ncbi:MAG: tRNA (adenosine(37)-N6)-dimethylallyltransferase MiaA [Clostridiales bacterium]|jgi:tRNA dimethylallyltransferase|nr:tRNA (adenosine(37)-N6)-dimethylallyltransferase MiaA [Bacillota bacterium]NLL55268.1 tRNA (adenosine(37)-N6)-dimethylallyltransferase MiaA [Clostridiales bacterium]